ncbi:MAG: hypothetical protein U9Q00_11875 [Synergistota bacterium]|nr:hypothetical protein [Synergistota bacterium]
MKRTGVEDDPLSANLAANGFIAQSLEDLAIMTDYGMILSRENDTFPYVKTEGGVLDNNYVMTCRPGDSREKAHDHLRDLFSRASSLVVHDKYFFKFSDSTKNKFFDLFPEKKLNVFFSGGTNATQKYISDLKREHNIWTIKKDNRSTYPGYHDRYVLIDEKMEIVITSGIDYLFDDKKECILIFRRYSEGPWTCRR